MSDMTREQAYRRWKKGEDQHALAKEMRVTRERMRLILKKMDENVPLVDRIEALEEENSRLREALGKALERLEASNFTNAEHAQAAEIIHAKLKERTNDQEPM